MVRRTATFTATGDDGRAYRIVVLEAPPRANQMTNRGTPKPGRRWIETRDGRRVAPVGKGRYVIVGAGVRLTCDDPDAP